MQRVPDCQQILRLLHGDTLLAYAHAPFDHEVPQELAYAGALKNHTLPQ
jgi:hypothetical protein